MANKNNPTQSTETKPKKERKEKKPNKLRIEMKRVAEATGLPLAFVAKQIKAEKEAIVKKYREDLESLATRVAPVVIEAIKNVKIATTE